MSTKRNSNDNTLEDMKKPRTTSVDATLEPSLCRRMVCDRCGSTSFDHEEQVGCDHEERSLQFFDEQSL